MTRLWEVAKLGRAAVSLLAVKIKTLGTVGQGGGHHLICQFRFWFSERPTL